MLCYVCCVKKVVLLYKNYSISFQGMILLCILLRKVIDFK